MGGIRAGLARIWPDEDADRPLARYHELGAPAGWVRGAPAGPPRIWPAGDAGRLLERYHELEPQVEEGRAIPYRDVLAETLARVATEEGLPVPPGEEGALGESLPSWKPFLEVPGALAELRGRGFKLAPLSNTDPDFLAASLERLGRPVDGQGAGGGARTP